MIPTDQTILHDPDNGAHGNCLSAVLASLLHIDIAEVPLFVEPETWRRKLNEWLRPRGLAYIELRLPEGETLADHGIQGLHHESAGFTSRSPEREVLHACVGIDGEVVFDPHPSRAGLLSAPFLGVFVALRPWEVAS